MEGSSSLTWSDIYISIYVRFKDLMLLLSRRTIDEVMDQKLRRMYTYDSYNPLLTSLKLYLLLKEGKEETCPTPLHGQLPKGKGKRK